MIKLLSTDFDGTLVDHFATPPVVPELFELLSEQQAAGTLWAVNTGRELAHILEGLKEFRFPMTPDFVLTSEREIFQRGAEGEWSDFGNWNARCSEAHDELFAKAEPLLADVRAFLSREIEANPIYEGDRMVGLAAATESEIDRVCSFLDAERARVPGFQYQRNTIWVRFCHEDYSKGTALSELARLTGIPRAEIFAVGDHFNDLPMLDGRHAGLVACPGNAVDAVKAAVRVANGYVASGSCSAGVVEAVRYFAMAG